MNEERNFFYANSVDMALSPYDVSFRFKRNESVEGKGTAETRVADTFTVAMSVSHAKAMLPAIMHAISEFETRFGKVQLEPTMQAKYDQFFANLPVKQ